MGLLSTPISAGVRMAKEILSLRAQGRASEVTDQMMDAADPQYMFDNTPLLMDEASRLSRANSAGASTDMYHMTDKDFNAFANPSRSGMQGKGVYAASYPESDIDVPRGLGDLIDKNNLFVQGTNIMPLRFTGESFDKSIQRLDPFSDEGTKVLKRFGLKPNKTYSKIKGAEEGRDISEQLYDLASRQATKKHGNQRTPEWLEELKSSLNSRLKKAGYASTEDSYTGYQMAFDPKNVRSKFARFDPEFSNLKNLSASNPVATAAGLGGILAMTGSDDSYAGGPQSQYDPTSMSGVLGIKPEMIEAMAQRDALDQQRYGQYADDQMMPREQTYSEQLGNYLSNLRYGDDSSRQQQEMARVLSGILDFTPVGSADALKLGAQQREAGNSFEGWLNSIGGAAEAAIPLAGLGYKYGKKGLQGLMEKF